jgi:hypothetical protein
MLLGRKEILPGDLWTVQRGVDRLGRHDPTERNEDAMTLTPKATHWVR